jgi:hypothetical protein
MNKTVFYFCVLILTGMIVSCGGGSTASSNADSGLAKAAEPWEAITIQTVETVVPAHDNVPEYTILDKTQFSLDKFAIDEDGFYILFDGKTFNGWRGYNRDDVPKRWVIDDGAIKFTGSGGGEAQETDGGDLIFGHKFKNFELSVDWKCSKGANSGIFYLAQEIKGEPIYISAPESQVLDNENHPDARMGKDGNRQSTSLYDMIPAKPQNAKPFGEWNNTTIIVYRGTVLHQQNGENVLEYHLWTPQWTNMLQNSKFQPGGEFPIAFELMNNLGGPNREGYIGLQDHGDDVWFKNIRIKLLD